jgi:thiol-disulfide isomerase/thioredoxin
MGVMNKDNKKYIIVLLITVGIFIVVFGLVNFLNNKKIAHVEDLQRKITADLVATETQFELLKTAPCDLLNNNNVLSRELGDFGQKLDLAETNQGSNDQDVIQLKKYYSLLQVKDYLLMEELASKCDTKIDSILYFYRDDCPDCSKQGFVLTELKKQYPELRIYSFDTDLDFSVIETFSSLYDFGEVYPAIIVGDTSYQGLQRIPDIMALFPELVQNRKNREEIEIIINFIVNNLDVSEETISATKVSKSEYSFVIINGEKGRVVIDLSGNKKIEIGEKIESPVKGKTKV